MCQLCASISSNADANFLLKSLSLLHYRLPFNDGEKQMIRPICAQLSLTTIEGRSSIIDHCCDRIKKTMAAVSRFFTDLIKHIYDKIRNYCCPRATFARESSQREISHRIRVVEIAPSPPQNFENNFVVNTAPPSLDLDPVDDDSYVDPNAPLEDKLKLYKKIPSFQGNNIDVPYLKHVIRLHLLTLDNTEGASERKEFKNQLDDVDIEIVSLLAKLSVRAIVFSERWDSFSTPEFLEKWNNVKIEGCRYNKAFDQASFLRNKFKSLSDNEKNIIITHPNLDDISCPSTLSETAKDLYRAIAAIANDLHQRNKAFNEALQKVICSS